MNFKRALWIAVLTYAVSFIAGLIVIFAAGVSATQISEIPSNILYTSIIIAVILSAFFTRFYFKDQKIRPNAKEGFYFGITLIIIGSILDIIIFLILSFAAGAQQNITEYYSNPIFWIALILFVATTTIVGAVKGRKKLSFLNIPHLPEMQHL